MVGVGPLVSLVGQIASSFVGEEQVKAALPAIARDANPIAVAVEIGQGRASVVTVLPADVNASGWDNALEAQGQGVALRLGLRQVDGFPEAAAARKATWAMRRTSLSLYDITS